MQLLKFAINKALGIAMVMEWDGNVMEWEWYGHALDWECI